MFNNSGMLSDTGIQWLLFLDISKKKTAVFNKYMMVESDVTAETNEEFICFKAT